MSLVDIVATFEYIQALLSPLLMFLKPFVDLHGRLGIPN